MSDHSDHDQCQVLAVAVGREPDGDFAMHVSVDGRHLLAMDRERCLPYVMTWADAIARAEFDAAALAQFTGFGLDDRTALACVIEDLRPARPPLDCAAVAPLELSPLVSHRTRRGQVAAHLGDEHVMQLDAPAVYDHIAKVAVVAQTIALDTAYHTFITDVMGQPRWRADAMIADLSRWRTAELAGAQEDRDRSAAATRHARRRGPRASRQGPASLPDEVQSALLAYASAVAAARQGRRTPAFAAGARSALAEVCVAAGLDPEQVIPPPGAPLNPGGRWIPPRRDRNAGRT